MEGLDPLVINVNERQVIEVLQYEVRRVIVDASTLVVPTAARNISKVAPSNTSSPGWIS
jgi:hypothetical protein